MPKAGKKRPAEEKRPIDLTDDEALEHVYEKEVRDKLKQTDQKDDKI